MPRTALAPLILGDPDARLDGEDGGNQGRTCIVAPEPIEPIDDGAWSELWNVVIPAGRSAPLSALPADERQRDSDRWKEQSVFRRFGDWLLSKSTSVHDPDRLGSGSLPRWQQLHLAPSGHGDPHVRRLHH